MNGLGNPEAAKILSERINDLRADSAKNDKEASLLLSMSSLVALATARKKLPFLAGGALVAAGIYRGYQSTSRARASATEASTLLALHMHDMASLMSGPEDAGRPQ